MKDRDGEDMCAENGGWVLQNEKSSGFQCRKEWSEGREGGVMADWQTFGNDCVIYPSLFESEGCVQHMKAKSQ